MGGRLEAEAVYGAPHPFDTSAETLSVHEVIRRYHVALLGFLRRRLRVPEDANDIAQETYIRMLKYEGERGIQSPPSMLFRIAANIAVDYRRSAQRHCASGHVAIDSVELVAEQSAERTLDAERRLERLAAAIERLPPKCRRVFVLSRVHGLSYPEIAEECGISVKAVEKHVSRGLRLCLAEVGG